MIVLKSTTDSLELVTENTSSIDFNVAWVDHSSSGVSPSRNVGSISSIATSSLAAAPSAGSTRQIRGISLVNTSTGSASTIKVQIDNSSQEIVLTKINLHPGDSLNYSDGSGWYSTDSTGKSREQHLDSVENPGAGYMSPFYKVGSTMTGASILHCHSLSSGMPGAWSAGTPGLSGRVVNGTVSADSGSIYLRPSGSFPYAYLRGFTTTSTVGCGIFLCDFLWVNSGIATLTSAAQTISSIAWPARDINGLTLGDGVEVGILVTSTLSNSAISTTTMNYTGSDGTTNLTATISSVLAGSQAGTLYPFQLAAGSEGVRRIQSITLGSSYGSGGSISLVAFRRLTLVSNSTANIADEAPIFDDGIRLWPGTSLHLVQIPGATSATTIQGHAFIVEK
jgi:hypothetical protein